MVSGPRSTSTADRRALAVDGVAFSVIVLVPAIRRSEPSAPVLNTTRALFAWSGWRIQELSPLLGLSVKVCVLPAVGASVPSAPRPLALPDFSRSVVLGPTGQLDSVTQ